MVEVEGNTISSPRAVETAETSDKFSKNGKLRVPAGKWWVFTHNNWKPEHVVELVEVFTRCGCDYIFGEEVGKGTEEVPEGTPHLQGAIKCKTLIRPIETFNLTFKPRWAKMKFSWERNLTYCSKDGKYHTNVEMPEPIHCPEIYGWQLEVEEIVGVDPLPDDRTIHWFWEPTGNMGKSNLARWLVIKKNAVVVAGKAADMKHIVVTTTAKRKGIAPKIVVVDCPRSMRGYLSYTGMEEVKNGLFASQKYESDMHVQNRPHMIVLANFPPEPGREMSADRYHVVEICKQVPCESHGKVCIGRDCYGREIWEDNRLGDPMATDDSDLFDY